ncbi:MAG TPA: hypothetical protein VEU72_01210 [Nitrosopumilaceae archaeon]|nr:hypothetical protein [Nitrosopumilaceae archaeon]
MPQTIETQYDNFISEVSNELQKVDPQLAMQVMYYERRFTDVDPHVELHIHYKEGTNLDKKKDELDERYGLLLGKEGNHGMRAVGIMNLNRIYEISTDDDVEEVSGFASCASY